jgi:hypothetical protein
LLHYHNILGSTTAIPGEPDVYYLEQEWREMWVDTVMPLLHNPDKAFVAFCKSRAKRKPMG